MGQTYADIVINSPASQYRATFESVLVDTGATHTVLPAAKAESLEVEMLGQVPVRIADGSIMEAGLGSVHISIPGHSLTPTPCMVFLWPTEKYLIGCTTLENHGLKVNPTTETLEKAEYEL